MKFKNQCDLCIQKDYCSRKKRLEQDFLCDGFFYKKELAASPMAVPSDKKSISDHSGKECLKYPKYSLYYFHDN